MGGREKDVATFSGSATFYSGLLPTVGCSNRCAYFLIFTQQCIQRVQQLYRGASLAVYGPARAECHCVSGPMRAPTGEHL